MAQQANLKTLSIDGIQYTPSGEWTLQAGGKTIEISMNLDGTTSDKYTPEIDTASGPIRFSTSKDVQDLMNKSNVTLTAILRNGSVYQCSAGRVVNHVELNTDDGTVEIEFAGKGRFL